MGRYRLRLLAVVLLLAPAASAAAPASAAPAAAQLTVVHGIRGLVADVRLDNRLVLSGFAPERVTDALSVSAGRHRLRVWPTGAAKTTRATIDRVITLSAGEHATAAIGLSTSGVPTITVYDDAALLPARASTAFAVRGLAQSGPVRVVVDGGTFAQALLPGRQQVRGTAAGNHAVAVLPTTGAAPLVPPQDVPVTAGRATVLYLIGSQRASTLGWVAQTVRYGAASAPRRVDTGVGPPVGDPAAVPPALLVVAAGLIAGLVLARPALLRSAVAGRHNPRRG